MSLTSSLARQTPAAIRQRGLEYYRNGVVDLVLGDSQQAQAIVLGTHPYLVTLEIDDEEFIASCECPYFEEHSGVCKHVWATLLAAESLGFLTDDSDEKMDLDDPFDHDLNEHRNSDLRPWNDQLRTIAANQTHYTHDLLAPAGREILYIIRVQDTLALGQLTLEVANREARADGSRGKIKPQQVSTQLIPQLSDPADRQIFSILVGAHDAGAYYPAYSSRWRRVDSGGSVRVPTSIIDVLIPLLCQTGRCRLRRAGDNEDQLQELRWDEGPAWELCLEPLLDAGRRNYVVDGLLLRGEESMPLDKPALLLSGGFVFADDGLVARLNDFGAFGWILMTRTKNSMTVPVEQADEFLKQLLSLPNVPRLGLPPELQYEEASITPRPHLQVFAGRASNGSLRGVLSFDYEGELVKTNQRSRGFFTAPRRFLLRDHQAEANGVAIIRELGCRPSGTGDFDLSPRYLPRAVRVLTEAGWFVEAEGKVYQTAGQWRMEVRSGIDWFELEGRIEYGQTTATLPELLEALRRGENFVRLGDGTVGLLPEEWLGKYGMLAALGTVDGESLRFRRTQVGLLDALLASQPEVTFDEAFGRARRQMLEFNGVEPADPPKGFVGELRGYQREGLGWLNFLQQFGFGGCLADDMGLGKTVQVLALLESRRSRRKSKKKGTKSQQPLRASLVVVPASLMFNWRKEAQRFAPKLKLLDHFGPIRQVPGPHFDDYDVILTTYGTLRRDAIHFANVEFDYCILDEAQAIKNANTASAKATRLLQGDHRLALSGTPIENHLGELWSIFEFLNPGMLGSTSAFQLGTNGNRNPDESTRTVLARALRPFILRRTKDQVAQDLPTKTEQTLYCELQGAQRRQYQQLRNHFRHDLLNRVDRDGIAKSKMFVLEALLRLRQAACHPGLIDHSKAGQPSAKLDLLVPQLIEVAEEGHKALVFSQFVKLLTILRDRLDGAGIPYEYLDGRTKDRKSRVDNFQDNPECPLFLISLKAGGLGLNLTAAEYVFLLDPWWNPAVEAQAIDRTHRIGQTLPVFAYRIIARDTVEEKVLQLQDSKRALADAIITADNSLIRRIQREDLELLLS